MKVLLSPLLLCSLMSSATLAAFDQPVPSPELTAAAEIRLFNLPTPSGMLICPAILEGGTGVAMSFSGMRLYSLQELDSYLASASYSTSSVVAGVSYHLLGQSDFYMESTIGVHTSIQFLRRFAFGVTAEYNRIDMPDDYESIGAVSTALGAAAEISELFRVYATVSNPLEPKLSHSSRIHQQVRVSISISGNQNTELAIGVVDRKGYATRYQIAESYRIADHLTIIGGMMTAPFLPSAGFRVSSGRFALNYAYRYHSDLGGTHLWGITFAR
jgi:hypothetical protein